MEGRRRELVGARHGSRRVVEAVVLFFIAGCDGCQLEDTGLADTEAPAVTCGGDSVPTDGAPMGVVSLGEAEVQSIDHGGNFAAGDQDGDGCVDFAFASAGDFDEIAGSTRVFTSPVLGEIEIHEEWDGLLVAEPDDWAYAIASGDVNGDGLADWIVGGYGIRDDLGGVYVAYGPVTTSMELADEADAFLLGQGGMSGREDHEVVDLDNDGLAELLIGAPALDVRGTWSSMVYVVPGPVSGTGWLADVETLITTDDEDAQIGRATSAGGDLDGDGLADVVVGSPIYETYGGGVWVFESPVQGERSILDADATLTGDGGNAGGAVSSGWDVDGDGYGDLLLGSNDYGSWSGRAYLVFGPVEGTRSVDSADAIVWADGMNASVGEAVSLEQDMDGDGHADVVIGARSAVGAPNKGAVFVFYEPFEGTVNGFDAADAVLYTETDENTPFTGGRLASAGDVNGDGFDDLYIAGEVEYLVFGGER